MDCRKRSRISCDVQCHILIELFFFFNDPPPTEISTLSLHDALPISSPAQVRAWLPSTATDAGAPGRDDEFGAGILDPVGALAAASGGFPVAIGDAGTSPLSSGIEIREISPGPAGAGYRMVGADGTVYGFGPAHALGNAPVGTASAVGLEPTRAGHGYWVGDDTGRGFPLRGAVSPG